MDLKRPLEPAEAATLLLVLVVLVVVLVAGASVLRCVFWFTDACTQKFEGARELVLEIITLLLALIARK